MSWADVGKSQRQTTSTSDLVKLEGQKRLRLLLPPSGPESFWTYTISTPANGFRSWISPPQDKDFFAKNRRAFNVRPIHAGLAYDYEEGKILILEAGNQVWEAIKVLVDAGKDLSTRDIIITKKGSGRQTEYTVTDCDPTPFNVNVDAMEKPDIAARYQPPTYEQVLEDLRQLGFVNPEELFTTRPLSYEEAVATEVPFGKYKYMTLQEVYSVDSKYLLFLATKVDRLDLKECARVVCNHLMGTDYELHGIPPSVDEVTFVAPEETPAAVEPAPTTQPQQSAPQPPVQEFTDPAGNVWHLINGEWKLAKPATPPAPPTFNTQTAQRAPQQPTPQAVAPAFNRDEVIAEINKAFETDPKYKDFMLIINAMKEASAPHGKTSISDFTDEELMRLRKIVIGQ